MLRIGITGGIGSGKTTVCKVFELLGIPVFYADDVAKELMIKDAILIQQIKATFGEEAYFADQTLNRKYISDQVFKQPDQLKKLNSFVHPAVFRAFDNWYTQQKAPYVLKEAALLFESGSYQQNDYNILVSCPLALRIQRVMQRDKVTKEKVMERIAAQLPEETKQSLANYQIQNNEQEFIITQVLQLHSQLLKKAF
ncbi:dephospho-CoA kinase [Pedobacter cryophilus]|uniref:Dephospho-CoA kinase n=1 Tax=Pedobacter cryophilus TaxID=2571271 RepID=A0A4V5NWP9_9SPHI|nr:dephospho-CoA kinase [Pedobacter cryophilus]TKB95594.1 dephospho-CoA kinase [Pedobacter cryophilus]